MRQTPRATWFLCLYLICTTGCGNRECTPQQAAAHRTRDLSTEQSERAQLQQLVRQRLRAKAPQQSLNVLVLSGGGAYGAWGAGVLTGWRDAPMPVRRPEFDVVTGISTGALLSTFAFLDTPADDATMKEAYTTLTNDQVFKKRFLPFVPFSHSLYKTAPLKRQIDRFVKDDAIKRVAAAAQTNRKLYVGTVNLDSGRLKIWDLTALASRGEFEKYRQVVYAATAIPVMFEPVLIDGQMHVDGGARSQLFLCQRLLPIVRAVEEEVKAAHRPPNQPKPLNVWVVVNGGMGLASTCVNDHLLPIAMRSAETLLDAEGIGDLYRTKALADENHFPFLLCYYDVAQDRVSVPVHDFKPQEMLRLYNQGVTWGRRANWYEKVPPFPEDEF